MSAERYVIGLDGGTGGARALVADLSGNVRAIASSDCASSDNLGHLSGFPFGGSGSSLIEFMRFQFRGASAG